MQGFSLKKVILFLSLILVTQASYGYDYSNMCAPKPYPVSKGIAKFFSNATGIKFLFTEVAELEVKQALKKDFGSNFDVELKAYGAKNLLDGKFKSLEIKSKKIAFPGVRISNFNAQTLCDYNHIVLKGKDIYFAQNLLMKYSATISNEDFKAIVLSKEYLDNLNKMNISIGNRVIFKIFDPEACIENNRVKLKFKIMTPFFITSEVTEVALDTGLMIEDEKIVFADINLGSDSNRINLSKILPIINKLNPLTSEIYVSKTTKGIFKIKNVKVAQNKILVDGLFIIPKNYTVESR